MKLGTAKRPLLLTPNRPERRGSPRFAANDNPPDVFRPDSLPARIRRRAEAVSRQPLKRAQAALSLAVLTEQRHGRAFIAAPVLIGCGAVLWYGASAEPSLAGLLAGLLVPLAVYLRNRQRHPVLAAAAFAVALAAFGALLSAFEAQRAGTVLLDGPVTTEITGTVAGREAMGEGTFRYVLRLTDTHNPHLARPPDRVAVVARHSQPFPFGSTMEGTARLSPPSGPALPGLTDFSLGAYLSGIGANGFFYGPPRAVTGETRLEPGLADRAFEALARLRAGVGDRIRSVIPGDAGAFAAAIVTNEQRAISRRTMENLRLSGLAHVVAISGMNMVLAAGLFFVGLRTLFSLAVGFNQGVPTRKLAAVAALAGTIAYYMISGFAVSAERAFIMMVVMLIAVLADRPAFSLRNVALSALLIEAVTPSAVMTPSFQMSFAGTIGLVAGYEAWARRKSKKLAAGPPKHGPAAIPGMLWSAVAATVTSSVIGTLSTALFSLEHFQRLALAGVVANLIATPLIGIVVMPMALLAVVLMPFGLDRLPLVAMGKGVEGVLAIGDRVAGWGGEWLSGILPGWFVALAVASFLTLCLLRTRLRLLALPVLGLALLLLAMRPGPRMPDLLVAEDGQTAALVTGAGLALTDGTSRFVTDQWQRALRLGQSMPPIFHEPGDGMRADQRDDRYRPLTDQEEASERAAMATIIDRAETGRFHCKKHAWCLGRLPGGGIAAIVQNRIYAGLACDVADIVVAAASRSMTDCRSGALFVARRVLGWTGALTFTATRDPAKPHIEASASRSDRAWNRHRQYDWRSRSFFEGPPAGTGRLLALMGDAAAQPPAAASRLNGSGGSGR